MTDLKPHKYSDKCMCKACSHTWVEAARKAMSEQEKKKPKKKGKKRTKK